MSLARLPMCAALINEKFDQYSLLDAGCRTMALKPLLKGYSDYYGSDLIPSDGVLECNLEERLPFDDDAFDVVVCLDVLEHLNNPHGALSELQRVARKSVFLSLPNMYYIKFRWNFLFGRGLSGKYTFHPIPVLDRHRWVPSYSEAVEFFKQNSFGSTVNFTMVLPTRGRTKKISEPIERWLARKWPNLFAYGILCEISFQ